MKNNNLKTLTAWLPVIVWAAIIFKLSNGAVPVASQVYWQDYIFKKSAHMFFFGVLAVLTYRALRINGVGRAKAAFWAIMTAMIYGASDEIHQSFTQMREARIRDVGFDTIGGSVAISVVYYLFPKFPDKVVVYLKALNLI